jgi:hypothetical protein
LSKCLQHERRSGDIGLAAGLDHTNVKAR